MKSYVVAILMWALLFGFSYGKTNIAEKGIVPEREYLTIHKIDSLLSERDSKARLEVKSLYYDDLKDVNQRTVGYMGNILSAVSLGITIIALILGATWWRNNTIATRLRTMGEQFSALEQRQGAVDTRLSEFNTRLNEVAASILRIAQNEANRVEANSTSRLDSSVGGVWNKVKELDAWKEAQKQQIDGLATHLNSVLSDVWDNFSKGKINETYSLFKSLSFAVYSQDKSAVQRQLEKVISLLKENRVNPNSFEWVLYFDNATSLVKERFGADPKMQEIISEFERIISEKSKKA